MGEFVGKHARPRSQHSHRKPSPPRRVAAVTGVAALGTVAAGTIIAAGTGHAAVLPDPQPKTVAGVAPVQAPQLHAVSVRQVLPDLVTVAGGDTLSAIAARDCGSIADWTGIYVKNKKTIGADYNLIRPKQVLTLDCKVASIPVVATTDAHVLPRRTSAAYRPRPAAVYPARYSGSGWHQRCIIDHESGGNSQVTNASGHYGLYQFSESTWVGSGGSAADFGHASVAEQNQVFENAVAARGYSDWDPYDGC